MNKAKPIILELIATAVLALAIVGSGYMASELTKDSALVLFINALATAIGLAIAINLAGLPAMSIPAGFVDGMPVGIQIIGNYFAEDRLLNIAHQYQHVTDWHQRTPKGFE